MYVISVTNQKGGTGKTTTAGALASGLSLRGYKTLVIDLDAQCNLSLTYGATKIEGKTALEVLTNKAKALEVIQQTPSGHIMPASKSFAGADADIKGVGREYRLKKALEDIKGLYDFVIIDTPPALSILTINALTASNSVVMPAQADVFSLYGLEQLTETLSPVKEFTNPNLKVAGILLTRYNSRSILSRDVTEGARKLAQKIGTKVFDATIREAIVVKEAQISQQTLYSYAPNAKVTQDYEAFITELLETI